MTLSYPQDFRSTVDADLEVRGTPKFNSFAGRACSPHRIYERHRSRRVINQRPATSIEEGGEFTFAETARFDKLRVEAARARHAQQLVIWLPLSRCNWMAGQGADYRRQGHGDPSTLNFRNNPYEITRA